MAERIAVPPPILENTYSNSLHPMSDEVRNATRRADTPAPIPTARIEGPEEIAAAKAALELYLEYGDIETRKGAYRAILSALATERARREAAERERDELRENLSASEQNADKWCAQKGNERTLRERAEAQVASLTETIRFAADRCADAGLHGTEEVLRAAISPPFSPHNNA